jgi:hypothetical protein
MDPSGASIVKIVTRNVNPLHSRCGMVQLRLRFAAIDYDRKLAAQQVGGSVALCGRAIPGHLMIVSYCCHDRD